MANSVENGVTNSPPLPHPGGLPVQPWYTQRWPWILLMGPGIVVLAAIYTGYLAFANQDALVVGDYYKQGKAINQDLRRDRAAIALGLSATMRYDAAHGRLEGGLYQFGQPWHGTLVLHLAHATQPDKDIKMSVEPGADGHFSAALPMLERTRWTVLIENDKRDWRLDGSWIWPAQHEVAIAADTVL